MKKHDPDEKELFDELNKITKGNLEDSSITLRLKARETSLHDGTGYPDEGEERDFFRERALTPEEAENMIDNQPSDE